MAKLCRRLEKQYNLQQVLSPRAFLSPEERLLPRHDIRKEKLKTDIQQTLKAVNHYSEFETKMTDLGYKVIKGRGISFIDDKKVKIKGSEVGFSLMKIEKILSLKKELTIKQKEDWLKQQPAAGTNSGTYHHKPTLTHFPRTVEKPMPGAHTTKQLTFLLSKLLESEPQMGGGIPYELTEEYLKRKRKKQKISH
jgi:hypothetical protein